MHFIRIVAFATLVVLLLGCSASAADPGRAVDEYFARSAPFGFAASMLVAKDGRVIVEKGYGIANREFDRPYTAETVFDIGSLTKQFTATAILLLEQRGKLKVTDPISKYFPGVPADKAAITLHHLLTHSSGLVDGFGDDYEVMSRDSIVKAALDSKLLWAPGTRYRYSNAGYSLLGAIVELVSGQPYEKFLRANLFDPAGMKKTGYKLGSWAEEDLAVGYRGTARWGTPLDHAWDEDGPWWNLRANGGILSTVGDLYRWHVALSGTSILTEESKKKLFAPHVPEDEAGTSHYGYGWSIGKTPRGTRVIQHSGGNGVFYAHVLNYVDEGLVVILGTAGTSNPAALVRENATALALGAAQPVPPATVPATAPELDRYTGYYRTASGVEVEVEPSGTGLTIRPASVGAGALLVQMTPVASAERYGQTKALLSGVANDLAAGKTASMVAALPEGNDAREEEQFWKQWFADMTGRHGAYKGFEVVGAIEDPGGQLLFGVVYFERTAIPVRALVQPNGKLFINNSPMATVPRAFRLAPAGKDRFVTWNFKLNRATTLALDPATKRIEVVR